jgi:hypothetical protein
MFSRDILIPHLAGLLEGFVQDFIETGRDIYLGVAAHPGEPGKLVIHPLDESLGINFQFFQEGRDEPFLLGQEGAEHMSRLDLRIL